jgi:transposase
VESAVLIAERWILAALRNFTFFSLAELNQAISEKLVELNHHKFQKLDTSRQELFKTLDRPALKPLPEKPYEYAEWKNPRVHVDYHIEVEGHYYSVPHQLASHQVEVRLTAQTVEVLFKHRRVTSHPRSYRKGAFTTLQEHMPPAHQKYLEWTPVRMIRWANQIGPNTEKLITHILENKPHPQQGFRSCLGIFRLGKVYSKERLEAACAYALSIRGFFYKSVESILKHGIDQKNILTQQPQETLPLSHPNVRGKEYYQ